MNGKRRLIGSFWRGSMANAMPQAIGAQGERGNGEGLLSVHAESRARRTRDGPRRTGRYQCAAMNGTLALSGRHQRRTVGILLYAAIDELQCGMAGLDIE